MPHQRFQHFDFQRETANFGVYGIKSISVAWKDSVDRLAMCICLKKRKSINWSCCPVHPLNTNKLLFGDDSLNYNDNCLLFASVQLFTKQSGRFM